ncbi:MAG TPA: hypothetical protein VGB44_08035 [Flavobacterium sp.]|jgi:ABC-type enterochelin transport system permease subunit
MIRFALFFVIAMSGISIFMHYLEQPVMKSLLKPEFFGRLLIQFVAGLIIGYFAYRYQRKQDLKNLPD